MKIDVQAGKPVPKSKLINVERLVTAYYTLEPEGPVKFGTSGHRGSSLMGTFNELHISATVQAICDYRKSKKITGPLFLGFDTHALSEPAFRTSIEVFAANHVETVIHTNDEYTPTPVISFLILEHNKTNHGRLADGVVITPSHNPPQDGGFKYNPPHGGPADIDVTGWVQQRANEIISKDINAIKKKPYLKAYTSDTMHKQDFIRPFVKALSDVVDMESIKKAGLKIGVDPMGGAGIHYWGPIAETYGLNLELLNSNLDPKFEFMTLDMDGEIRMDCSSPYAMTGLISMADRFDIAWGNDPDFDRHGIVCPTGLMNPNHYLAVAIWYLLQNRPLWKGDLMIGKTIVSSSMIDKVVAGFGRRLYEVPVGFKWFVQGLLDGRLAFGGEESAGASFLRQNGSVWTTDKDGFALTLLAAEILAITGKTPAEIYQDILVSKYGESYYARADRPVSEKQKKRLKSFHPEAIKTSRLAGLKISAILTSAPGNGESFGGVKIILEDGSWMAIRPSGTEPKMKVYIESYGGEEMWNEIYQEAVSMILGQDS